MTAFERTIGRIKSFTGMKKAAFLILCALVFALPFMNGSLWIFSYLGLSGLFLIIFDFKMTGKRVFGSLFCFFFFFYFFAYSWFVNLYPLDFVGLGSTESILVIATAVILIPIIHGTLMSLPMLAGYLTARKSESKILGVLLVCSGYVVGEYLQSLGDLAFPWTALAVGQTEVVELVQSVSLLGARFVTVVILLVNAFVSLALVNVHNKKKMGMFAALAILVFGVNGIYGIIKVNVTGFEKNEKITAVALQGNIPSGEKMTVGAPGAMERYQVLCDRAAEYAKENNLTIDVAVLPETAFPVVIDKEQNSTAVKASYYIAEKLNCDTFVGAFKKEQDNLYNSLYLFSQDRKIADKTFDKLKPVPFGEFLPYSDLLNTIIPGFFDLNTFFSDISAGESVMPIETSSGKAACLVCFDSIFPENARLQVKKGAEFIVISTNDSWYKTSVALDMHASHAILRAVENGRSVVRSANTGISMIIDPNGKVVASSGVNTEEFVMGDVPLRNDMTLYTMTGDLILPLCLIFFFTSLIYIIIKERTCN